MGEKRGVTQRASARTPGVADFGRRARRSAQSERRGEIMRLTIVAGLILGASLAVQSMLGVHAKAKARFCGDRSPRPRARSRPMVHRDE